MPHILKESLALRKVACEVADLFVHAALNFRNRRSGCGGGGGGGRGTGTGHPQKSARGAIHIPLPENRSVVAAATEAAI